MRASTAMILVALLSLVGCGGGASGEPIDETGETTAADAQTTGDEAIEDEPIEDEPEAEPPPSGPGQLRVVNLVGGSDGGGTVRVMDESGDVVGEGASGTTFDLPSGSYRVEGTITDRAVLVDTPTRSLDGVATVDPGETATANVEFGRARVRFVVRRRGTEVRAWRITVHPAGAEEPTITLEPSGDTTPISPGRYEGTLRAGSAQIEVNGLIFQGGATMTVPINMD